MGGDLLADEIYGNASLCWFCKKAYGLCKWARYGKQMKDCWESKDSDLWEDGASVKLCVEFVPDESLNDVLQEYYIDKYDDLDDLFQIMSDQFIKLDYELPCKSSYYQIAIRGGYKWI